MGFIEGTGEIVLSGIETNQKTYRHLILLPSI